jgi:Neutral/alkaline non-lysosomal ceramidase, N-terminal
MPRLLFAFLLPLAVAVFALLPASTPAEPAEPDLLVGFGERDITPKVGGTATVYMAGFGQNRKAVGVHDPLLARAVVWQHGKTKIAVASVDLVGFFLPSVENVRKQLDGFSYVLVSSTHNHEGPDTLGLWGPTPLQSGVDAAYVKAVEEQIVAAIKAADGAKKTATAKIGGEKAPELLHDAREPYIKHDDLVALEFRDKDDKLAGLVVQWNCHPETLESKNKQISADFVGYTVKHLQDKYRCPVVYLTGTVGGLMTSMHVEIKSADGKKLDDGSYEKTERYGVLLGEAAERALKKAKPIKLTPLEAKARTLFLPVDNKLYQVARQIGVLTREGYVWNDDPYHAEPLKPADKEKRQCIKTEVALLRLGDLEIAAIPGEIYPELVLDKVQAPPDPGADFPNAPIEPAIYKQLKGPQRMLVGLANDEIGYIIPKRQWDEMPPFCYGRTKAQYGEMNSLGPDTAPLLCKAFKELVAAKK